jgi:hypothetical protein
MSRSFKTVDYAATLNQTVRLGDCLPPDHLARFIVDVIAQLDWAPIYARYAPRGGAPYICANFTRQSSSMRLGTAVLVFPVAAVPTTRAPPFPDARAAGADYRGTAATGGCRRGGGLASTAPAPAVATSPRTGPLTANCSRWVGPRGATGPQAVIREATAPAPARPRLPGVPSRSAVQGRTGGEKISRCACC